MKTAIGTTMILILGLGTAAFGAEKTKSAAKGESVQITTEQRKNMAAAHEKMAECLRTDKVFQTCQNEMMQSCQDMMGKDGCSGGQMGYMQGMPGRGMMQGHDMMDYSNSKSGTTSPADANIQGK